MTDFYIDQSAGGTGDALTPANAAVNIQSFCAAFPNSIQFGDRFWVRKTHHEPLWASNGICKASYNPSSHEPIWVIGWPNSGMPFYQERPAAGVSASWDADAYIYPDLPGFTVTVSRATAPTWSQRDGTYLTNVTFAASNALSLINPGGFFPTQHHVFLGKVNFLNCWADISGAELGAVDDWTICTSKANTDPLAGSIGYAKRITITASCLANHIFESAGMVRELILNSNSISFLQRVTNNAFLTHFGRVHGIGAFVGGDACDSALTDRMAPPVYADDWFGQGPRRIGIRGEWNYRRVTSATAQHSGSPATAIMPQSGGFGVDGVKQRHNLDAEGQAGGYVNCLSGTPLVIRWHIWLRDCGSLGLARSGRVYVPALGCGIRHCTLDTTSSGLYVGSAGLWSGQSLGTGSAYMMEARFVPQETVRVEACANLPQWSNTGSGVAFVAPFFAVSSA